MSELKLVRGATLWLRRLGLSFVALVAAAAMTLVALSGANANQDPGWNSTVDFAANLSNNDGNRVLGPNNLSLPLPTGTSAHTVEMWVRPSATVAGSSGRVLINAERKYAIISNNGNWAYYVGGGRGTNWEFVETRTQIAANRWVHLSLVLTATDTLFYVDGKLVHSRGSRTNSGTATSVDYLGIGGWGGVGG